MKAKSLIGTKIYKDFRSETKVSEKSPRTLVVKISTPEADRSHDVVIPKGIIFDDFMANPVVLFAHKYDSKPIAKCTTIKAQETGVIATVEFTPVGMNPEADMVFQMYKEGFLNAWSIGFIPKDYDTNENGGHDFKSWELLEFSSVPVPDNAKALTIMRSFGVEKKDVAEVVALSDIVNYLGFLVSAFEDNMVNEDCIEKMKQALQLLLSVIEDEAVLGEKQIKNLVVAKNIPIKEEHKAEVKEITPNFIKRLQLQLKESHKTIGLTLRLLKEIKKEKIKGGENNE